MRTRCVFAVGGNARVEVALRGLADGVRPDPVFRARLRERLLCETDRDRRQTTGTSRPEE